MKKNKRIMNLLETYEDRDLSSDRIEDETNEAEI